MAISKAGKWAILNGALLLILTLSDYFGLFGFNLVFSYGWHKILHLVGVILLMGNMVAGPIWFSFAYYSGDRNLLRFASRLLQITDMWLTVPGVFLIVVNGLCMASSFGGTHGGLAWLSWSVVAMFVMWALSVPVIYFQEKMYRAIDSPEFNALKIKQLLWKWGVWGTLVMLPPTLVFYWMVMKSV